MRRDERVTVQGPVKEQQPDGMSHRGLAIYRDLPQFCRDFSVLPQFNNFISPLNSQQPSTDHFGMFSKTAILPQFIAIFSGGGGTAIPPPPPQTLSIADYPFLVAQVSHTHSDFVLNIPFFPCIVVFFFGLVLGLGLCSLVKGCPSASGCCPSPP